ncbi:MAG: hypothetical protein RIS08_1034 [Actinomycetota bacterium]|jgi:glutamate-1-semialdehyde 2,1-aminomutase
MPKVAAIVQARMGSSRLPNKSLRLLHGKSLVELVGCRLSKCSSLDQIIFAIPKGEADDILANELASLGYAVFRGPSDDVQKRYVEAAQKHSIDVIVRVTADCPLIDWHIVDRCVEAFIASNSDLVSNVSPPSFADGLDVEVFSTETLVRSRSNSPSAFAIEHVTWDLRESGRYKVINIEAPEDFSNERWTVDYESDLESLAKLLPENFESLCWEEIRSLGFRGVMDTARIRNEGAFMGSGQKLWTKAKGLIPGGGMLLSKRAEMFLPNLWPSYYSKAKGFKVWDLDGVEYSDFALMGVGTSSLGYGDDAVDEAVIEAVRAGVMSSLNSPGEVMLAERLVELNPWADMVRFTRSGGEANSVAVRIARAATGRDKVLVCGYHGWHDWYLAANLSSEDALNGHLLPGLDPAGVPKQLAGSISTFQYNDIQRIRELVAEGGVAAIKMEVERNSPPEPGFLQSVRKLCDENDIVLIFDECTSGFRETFGGLHSKYGVEPDLAMYGKALGNGYAIAAVVGRELIMQAAQQSFISSTFWTERLGPEAAVVTLRRMEESQSWNHNLAMGIRVKQGWQSVLQASGLPFTVFGLDAMPSFIINLPEWNSAKTLITQEFLKANILATSSFYPSLAHKHEDIDWYLDKFSSILEQIARNWGESYFNRALLSQPAHQGFRRLN